MTETESLIDKLGTGDALHIEAGKEIIRLRKIVDALTVKLNAELTNTYKIEERLTVAEQRMAKLFQMVTALRMNAQ